MRKKNMGHAQLMVLTLLSREDMYGYQIITELSRRSDHTFEMQEGTLYPVLHGLWKEGAVESYEKEAPTGRVRKYYRITEKGKKRLEKETREWMSYQRSVNAVLGFRAVLEES